jgi:hypothetical protein
MSLGYVHANESRAKAQRVFLNHEEHKEHEGNGRFTILPALLFVFFVYFMVNSSSSRLRGFAKVLQRIKNAAAF